MAAMRRRTRTRTEREAPERRDYGLGYAIEWVDSELSYSDLLKDGIQCDQSVDQIH